MERVGLYDRDILGLCSELEWCHRNAFTAVLRNLEKVDLLQEHRDNLDKIKALAQYGDRVTIIQTSRRFQRWYQIKVDDIEVAHAYIDHELFVGKSWWTIYADYNKIENASVC